MIGRNEESSPRVAQVYMQYVQFVNQSHIVSPLSILFLLFSHLVIFADLLAKLSPDNLLVQDITFLGISPMLFAISLIDNTISYIIDIVILIFLLSPLLSVLSILYYGYWGQSGQRQAFKQKFQKSLLHSSLRSYFQSFSYFYLPVFISYATKIIGEGGTSRVLGVALIMLAICSGIVIEYHILELQNNDTKNTNLVPLNFPYHLLDTLLVVVALILINLLSGAPCQILGLAFTILRALLAFYMPFFNDHNQKYYKLIVVSSSIASLGLLISFYNINHNYNLFLILMLVAYLLFIHSKTQEIPAWQQINLQEAEEQGFQNIKKKVINKGLFVRGFRSLIFLGRQNLSHRTLLQIEIMKSKCYSVEKVHKGGNRVCSAMDVIKFQDNMIKFMKNFLVACQLSVSVLKFMQSKEGRKETLAKAVERLVNILVQNQEVIKEMFHLNEYSPEVKVLLLRTYAIFYNDTAFLKESQKWMSELLLIQNQKELKDTLFNDKSVAVFINILQQLGKVVKISKNLPTVLGYQPSNLLGLSINEIIPFSVKKYHDQNLLDFIERYSIKQAKKNPMLNFFAYNSDFHLQEVNVRYSWVMNDFNSFHMAGIVQKVELEENVILTDQYGNLEGWTKGIGSEELNLDSISISQRLKYNIMPLFPTLVKYMDSLGVSLKTIFFKTSKVKDGNLIVVNSEDQQDLSEVQYKILKAFRKMVKDEEIVGACFAEIELVRVSLCQGRANLRQITIHEYQTVENLSQILGFMQKLQTLGSCKTDRSMVSFTSLACNDMSQKQEQSVFSQDNRTDKRIDSNFSMSPQRENLFSYDQMAFGQFNSSKTTFDISVVCQNTVRMSSKTDENLSTAQDTSFNPALQKNGTLFWYVLLVTIISLILFILNLVDVVNAGTLFTSENKHIVARNKAFSIYLKSVFNPNATYIDRFINGSLLENLQSLNNKQFNYTTFTGNLVIQNQYYLFNTQIPATLQRLVNSPIIYNATTVDITPPTNAEYYRQITANYLGVIQEYNTKFTDALTQWDTTIDTIERNFFIRFGFLCLATLAYCFLLILMYFRERRHKETLEAFFKFEKEDLEKKIGAIGVLVRQMEAQAAEMNLLKEFSEVVKREEISNVQFGIVKNIHEVKVKFDHDAQTEAGLQKKKYYLAVGGLIVFILVQVIFLIVHSVINTNTLSYYRSTPHIIDSASKLIVYPNYLLADIHLSLPADIKSQYDKEVSKVLSAPTDTIPELYPFLRTVPCANCLFMYPVLTTNFKSFYSTFDQRAVQLKNNNITNKTSVQDLFYAADYVTEKLTPVLLTSSYSYVESSIAVYLLSILVLCIAIYVGSASINTEIQKLETFLKFFSEETITKNKHMNRLFTNFQ